MQPFIYGVLSALYLSLAFCCYAIFGTASEGKYFLTLIFFVLGLYTCKVIKEGHELLRGEKSEL